MNYDEINMYPAFRIVKHPIPVEYYFRDWISWIGATYEIEKTPNELLEEFIFQQTRS